MRAFSYAPSAAETAFHLLRLRREILGRLVMPTPALRAIACFSPLVCLGLAMTIDAGRASAAEIEPEVVMLPPLIVQGSIPEPPWRYAATRRFQLLSCCPDRLTEKLVHAITVAYDAVYALVPKDMLPKLAGRDTLILLDEAYWPARSQESVAALLRSVPGLGVGRGPAAAAGAPAPVSSPTPLELAKMDPLARGGPLEWNQPGYRRAPTFFRHLCLMDSDATATFVLVSPDELDLDGWRLSPGALRELLERRVPQLPPWFVSGFLAVYRQLHFDGGQWTLPPAIWLNEEETRQFKRDPARAQDVMPLGEFFAAAPGARDGSAKPWLRLSEGELLVRWALEPGHHDEQKPFWELVERASTEPVTAALFTECIGADFDDVTARLRAYLPSAIRTSTHWRVDPDAAEAYALREATPAEVARIMGDWERLETTYVRAHLPTLTDQYYRQAHRRLQRNLDAGGQDPDVLAALGMLEYGAGRPSDAHQLLEAAVKRGIVRPGANTLLALLRYDEVRATSGGGGDTYSATALRPIFALLESACAQEPPLAETYALLAEAWSHCAAAPTSEQLAILDHGAALFRQHPELAGNVAALLLAHGETTRARALLAASLPYAARKVARQRLLELQAAAQKN